MQERKSCTLLIHVEISSPVVVEKLKNSISDSRAWRSSSQPIIAPAKPGCRKAGWSIPPIPTHSGTALERHGTSEERACGYASLTMASEGLLGPDEADHARGKKTTPGPESQAIVLFDEAALSPFHKVKGLVCKHAVGVTRVQPHRCRHACLLAPRGTWSRWASAPCSLRCAVDL